MSLRCKKENTFIGIFRYITIIKLSIFNGSNVINSLRYCQGYQALYEELTIKYRMTNSRSSQTGRHTDLYPDPGLQ